MGGMIFVTYLRYPKDKDACLYLDLAGSASLH